MWRVRNCRDLLKITFLTICYFDKICISDIRTLIFGVESDWDNHKIVNIAQKSNWLNWSIRDILNFTQI